MGDKKKVSKKAGVAKEETESAPNSPVILPGCPSPIAVPLASEKLSRKLLKLVKLGVKGKDLKRGVKEVVKSIRKGQKGLVILAADISPMDVLSHLPVLCEEASCPYIFVPSKQELGFASCTKRPTSIVLIIPRQGVEYMDKYEECIQKVKTSATA